MIDQPQLPMHPPRRQFVNIRVLREIGYSRSFQLLFGVGLARWLFLHLISALLSIVLIIEDKVDIDGIEMIVTSGTVIFISTVLPYYTVC